MQSSVSGASLALTRVDEGGGMGWKGALRSMNAEIRRQERAAARRAREAERAWKAQKSLEEAMAARYELEAYEAYMEALVSVHRESSERVDWHGILERPEPPKPEPAEVDTRASEAARADIEQFQPNLFERLFGLKGRMRRLEEELEDALMTEEILRRRRDEAHAAALEEWTQACEDHAALQELARKVLDHATDAYGEVVRAAGCFDELGNLLGKQTLSATFGEEQVEVRLTVPERDVVPEKQKSVTKRGKLSTKNMPKTKAMETYQDFVCGAALRVARELLAVLPIRGVLVHVSGSLLNSASGHFEETTILSVYCPREKMESVAWDFVDASDLVESLAHHMKLKRGKGFTAVEPLVMPA